MPKGIYERHSKSIQARLEEFILPEPNSGCWLWDGHCDLNGYGKIGIKQKDWLAHRLSYKTFVGDINGFHVLHKCDNPSCVNPEHLFLGTDADNMADKVRKGRQPRGSAWHRAKFDDDKIKEIRSSDDSQRTLALRYGVNQSVISRIKSGETYNS